MKINVVMGLLGLIAGLLIAIVAGSAERPAYAQGMSGGSMLVVPANYNQGQEDIVWILDAASKRMACYRYKNNKVIELIGARNVKFDLQVEEFEYTGRHVKPSDIEDLLKKRDRAKKPKK